MIKNWGTKNQLVTKNYSWTIWSDDIWQLKLRRIFLNLTWMFLSKTCFNQLISSLNQILSLVWISNEGINKHQILEPEQIFLRGKKSEHLFLPFHHWWFSVLCICTNIYLQKIIHHKSTKRKRKENYLEFQWIKACWVDQNSG